GFALLAIAPLPLHARGDARNADALYDEGAKLVEHGEWQSAIDRLSQAQALQDSPRVRLELGRALSHVGSLVRAFEVLQSVSLNSTADQATEQAAKRELIELERRLPRLTLIAEGKSAGSIVLLDGRLLATGPLEHGIPVDPGRRTVAIQN